ncbi:MAG: helix-turn-helix transcriptional regulator [Opitutaceae bacterium]|nr:helix-turn-helix transcriptional regulator [Opitutaceae bacterium]
MSTCDFHTPVKHTSDSLLKNIVGANVRKIRFGQKVPVSQQDLAGRLAALGISIDRSAIARIERGDRYVLDYEAAAIARAFRVPITELFRQTKE